jgi:hypothetical protein
VAFQLEITATTELYCGAKMLAATARLPPNDAGRSLGAMVQGLAKSGVFKPQAVESFEKEVAREPQEKLKQVLADRIDKALIAYNQLGKGRWTEANTTRRAAVAEDITRSQMLLNFMLHEANVAPGANLSILGKDKVKVVGAEAYQAALSHLTAYVEHRVRPENERDYQPYKYITRIIDAARNAGANIKRLEGIEHLAQTVANLAELDPVTGRPVNKFGRDLLRNDVSLPGNAGMIDSSDIVAALAEFDREIVPVILQMQSIAQRHPEGPAP